MRDYEALYNERLNEELAKVMFPEDQVHPKFVEWKTTAMNFHNKFSLQCTEHVIEAILVKCVCSYNLHEMVNAMNAVQGTTPHQMCMTPYAHNQMDKDVQKMVMLFEEMAAPIRAHVKKEIEGLRIDDLNTLRKKQTIVKR